MVFSSPVFLFLFLPLTLLCVLGVRKELRNLALLLASLVFYAWGEGEIVLFLGFSIIVNYLFGQWLERTADRKRAKWVAGLAIVFNLALLAVFKYANFAVENLNQVLAWFHQPALAWTPIRLPIGVSFFTFHSMSYVIDVYRRDTEATRSPVDFALYISLFPQLLAGPIIRYKDIAAQIIERTTRFEDFAYGVRRFIIGLSKKILIADILAAAADPIFTLPAGDLSTPLAWFAVACFVLQVYFDFSGYSDMAIGLGRMFGFRIRENFDYPYISQSLREFWRRWHISLSTWFRDYLYIPMGGNRASSARTYFNLFTVFVLCGLWHGANWNFLIFGLIQGGVMVVERLGWESLLRRAWRPLRHAYLLLILAVSFVFFRAPDLGSAAVFIRNMFSFVAQNNQHPLAMYVNLEVMFCLIAAAIASLPIAPALKKAASALMRRKTALSGRLAEVLSWGSTAFLLGLFALSLLSMAGGTYNAFVYFRF